MEVKTVDNVNIYNLSCGKSLPEWLSERKRRMLQKKDIDVRKRIELIQDFEMPGVSTGVKMSGDGNFIFATGVYKPRIRCYDVNNLSMKFERCFDAEAVQFTMLSDDYTKFALLQCNRTIELHVQYGSYYKTRVPKFGRDMTYHRESCDLLVVGASSEIYRLNLEQGRFLSPYTTNASSLNKIAIHEGFDIIACGTMEGKVEAFDPRMRERISILDCALSCMNDSAIVNGFPSITSLSFKGDLTMAAGTFTGQVLLFDLRSNKPFLVKDHALGLPIKNIEFIESEELVASLDPKCVKFWKQNTGKSYTQITSTPFLNDMCFVPKSGLLFLANEDRKILSYFIPSIGPAPKWCCFLDSITEELQESKQDTVYDDYKFVTDKELDQLHLDHLKGTNLLRAYMHGYFMDIRLYNKAKTIVQPEAYKELKKKMVQNKIEQERNIKQIVVKQLPSVNREFARKLLEKKANDEKQLPTPFEDERFKDMFTNPDFEIKETDDEYARAKATFERTNKKKVTLVPEEEPVDMYEDEEGGSEDYGSSSDYESSQESDDETYKKEQSQKKKKNTFVAFDPDNFSLLKKEKEETDTSIPIEQRLKRSQSSMKEMSSVAGNKTVTWSLKKKTEEKHSKRDEERKAHIKERAKCRRSAKFLRK